MSAAYLDSSFLVAILLGEPRSRALLTTLRRFDDWLAGDLLVAEVLAAATREAVPLGELTATFDSIDLVLPDRSLEAEMREILAVGRLRGAGLWHLSCALFVAGEDRASLAFLSRDAPQRDIARSLGFPTP